MNKHVLIAAKDPEITKVIDRLVNSYEGFRGESIHSVAELASILKEKPFHTFLLGAGFTKEQEIQMRAIASSLAPEMKIIEHYGGGSGLLLEELNRE